MVFTDDNYHDGVTEFSGSIQAFKEGLLVSKDHHHHHHLTNCQRSGVRCFSRPRRTKMLHLLERLMMALYYYYYT